MANEPDTNLDNVEEQMEEPEYIIQQRQRQERRDEKLKLDEMDVDELSGHVGGYFRATALMQKRLRELIRYVPEATRFDNKQLISNVLEEIEQKAIDFEAMAHVTDPLLRGTMFDDE